MGEEKPWYERIGDTVVGVVGQMWRVIKLPGVPIAEAMKGALLALGAAFWSLVLKIRNADLFWLNVFGDSLRTTRVRFDQAMLRGLLVFTAVYVFWAWRKGFTLVDAGDYWAVALACVVLGSILVLDRSFGVADMYGQKKLWRFWIPRLALTLLLADISSVPPRLASFAEDIEARIAAMDQHDLDAARAAEKARRAALAGDDKGQAIAEMSSSAGIRTDRKAGHDEIAKRLDAATKKRDDASRGVGVPRRDRATVLATLSRDVAAIRAELSAYDDKTETLVTEVEERRTAELARRDGEKTASVNDVDKMTAADFGLAPHSRGFFARKNVLDEIESEPQLDADGQVMDVWLTRAQRTALGCWFMMMVPELIVLGWKLFLCSVECGKYLSRKLQALSNNPEAVSLYIPVALDEKADADVRNEAVDVLRVVAPQNDAAREALAKIGFDAVKKAKPADEVTKLLNACAKAQGELCQANVAFRSKFRDLCERREGDPPSALPRHRLNQEAERLWRESVAQKSTALRNAEYYLREAGISVPGWPSEYGVREMVLWTLPDEDLIELFGWTTRDHELLLAGRIGQA